jgi:hypothetical protein
VNCNHIFFAAFHLSRSLFRFVRLAARHGEPFFPLHFSSSCPTSHHPFFPSPSEPSLRKRPRFPASPLFSPCAPVRCRLDHETLLFLSRLGPADCGPRPRSTHVFLSSLSPSYLLLRASCLTASHLVRSPCLRLFFFSRSVRQSLCLCFVLH